MDYTGINYDYNDNLYVVEGVAPVGFGGSVAIAGLDDAAADDRLVFTNIDKPAGASQLFRNEASFTLTNDGLGPLAITGLTLGGVDADDFEIVGTTPTSIPEGGSVQVTVRFTGSDPVDDNKAVLMKGTLTVETDSGLAPKVVQLAGLAQNQSEQGEEPSVAQIVEAFGYTTDVAQGQLANGGRVETVGDEVLLPYLEQLDGAKPVEVIQLAAFLNQGNVARLSSHSLSSSKLTELFAADDQQGQTVLPDGLVPGPGDTGSVARASFNSSTPFGLKVTVDGRPTYASWTDPEANRIDPDFGRLVADDRGHLIRFFEAKDAAGNVIPGTYIGIQDYPGAGNYDYNDHMFVVKNVKAHALTAAEDANGDGILDALQTDADNDGTVAFFDADETPTTPPVPSDQAAFNGTATPWQVDGDGLTLKASLFDSGGQGVAYNDDGTKSGDQSVRPGENVDISNGTGAVGYTNAGEWLEYTIEVAEAGTYALSFNSSSPANGRALTATFEQGGSVYQAATAAVPNTGAYTTYQDTAPVTVALKAGVQVLRVNFDLAQQDLQSFTLAPVAQAGNQAPVTTGISGAPQATEDAGYAFDVSGFFSDPDGDGLSYALSGAPLGLAISPSGVISGAPDAEGTYTVLVTASDGTLSVGSQFDLVVAPVAQPAGQTPFPGPDAPIVTNGTLSVAARDYDFGGQDVAYNDAPGLSGGSNGGRAGSDVEQTAAGDIGWIDAGEWLEYTIAVPQGGQYDFDLLLATNAVGRSARVDVYLPDAETPYASTGSIANPSSGSYANFQVRSGEPVTLQSGIQIVRVTFEGGSQDFQGFTLNSVGAPANQAPTAAAIGAQSGDEGQAFVLDASGFFSDPDGDALTFSASGLPQGLSISPSGVISGTPAEDGTYAVTVSASDGSLTTPASFTLSVAAEPEPEPQPTGQRPFPGPSAPSPSNGVLLVDASDYDEGGQGVAYNDAPGLSGGTNGGRAGSDVEQTAGGDIGWIATGEWLEYTVSLAQGGLYDLDLLLATTGKGRSVKVDFFQPGSETPYATTGSIANASTGGWTSFAERSKDGLSLLAGEQVVRVTFAGSQDFRSFSLTAEAPTAINQAPTAGTLGAAEADQAKAFSLNVAGAFSDPDGDALSFTATGLPAGLSISKAGIVSGTPTVDGAFQVNVTATDPGGLKATTALALTVDPAPAGPGADALSGAERAGAEHRTHGGRDQLRRRRPGRVLERRSGARRRLWRGGVPTRRWSSSARSSTSATSSAASGSSTRSTWRRRAPTPSASTPRRRSGATPSPSPWRGARRSRPSRCPTATGRATASPAPPSGRPRLRRSRSTPGSRRCASPSTERPRPTATCSTCGPSPWRPRPPWSSPRRRSPRRPPPSRSMRAGRRPTASGRASRSWRTGKVIGSGKVTNAKASFDGTYDAFVFALDGTTALEDIAIRFTNDRFIQPGGAGNDRNLFIDRIELGDAVFEAEVDAFVKGDNQSLAQRFDLDGAREDMRINGTMLFDSLDIA